MYVQVIIVSFILLLLGALIGFLGFPMLFKELIQRVSSEYREFSFLGAGLSSHPVAESESEAWQRDTSAVAATAVPNVLQHLRLQCDQCAGGGERR